MFANGKMVVKVNGEKRGIMKMLDLVSSACKEPKFIGTRASSVSFINLDLNKAYDELFRILGQYQPMFAGSLNAPITPPTADGKAGVTLKEGILNHLGSEIVVCEFLDESDVDDGPVGGKMLASISVKNAEKLEETVSQLHSMFTGPETADAKREFMGRTIYLIKIPGLTAPPGPEIDSGDNQIQGGFMFASGDVPAFTITDTAILIGNESSVEQAIRILNNPSSESIGSVQWYRRARALVPQMVGIASFSNDVAQVEQFWKMLKKGFSGDGQSAGPISSGMVAFDVEGAAFGELGEIIDASTLPEFEKVRKYFGVSAFYGLSREDGFYFEFRDLTNADLD